MSLVVRAGTDARLDVPLRQAVWSLDRSLPIYSTWTARDLIARGLYALVERPLIGGSISAVTGTAGLGSRELARAQTGLVRSYALALAGGLAVLAVVFLAAR